MGSDYKFWTDMAPYTMPWHVSCQVSAVIILEEIVVGFMEVSSTSQPLRYSSELWKYHDILEDAIYHL